MPRCGPRPPPKKKDLEIEKGTLTDFYCLFQIIDEVHDFEIKTSNVLYFIIKILMYLSFYSFRLYRPFYLQLTNMPFINYSIQKPSSPFDADKPPNTQKQTQVKLRLV